MKLAGLTGIERTLISSCELGKRNVSLVTIEKFAKGLRCKMSELRMDAVRCNDDVAFGNDAVGE
jgi:transcriptional regulator with XRE-family HTH domain